MLERIPMELLALLVEHRGELVDTDNSINAAVRKVRQVLKDDPEQPNNLVSFKP